MRMRSRRAVSAMSRLVTPEQFLVVNIHSLGLCEPHNGQDALAQLAGRLRPAITESEGQKNSYPSCGLVLPAHCRRRRGCRGQPLSPVSVRVEVADRRRKLRLWRSKQDAAGHLRTDARAARPDDAWQYWPRVGDWLERRDLADAVPGDCRTARVTGQGILSRGRDVQMTGSSVTPCLICRPLRPRLTPQHLQPSLAKSDSLPGGRARRRRHRCSLHDAFVVLEEDVLSAGIDGGNGRCLLEEPNSRRLKRKSLSSKQGPHRAEIDHVARQLVVAGLAGKYVDFLAKPAAIHVQLAGPGKFRA